ncbi:hypothetical protein [Halorarius litoreus]|uniref:hypothetical protein n=1 Tax=Halorarius litoreus TaxID=2962676 RepID=UPI0020CE545F|nr:hypothetical protein [Halorarius litoreus]
MVDFAYTASAVLMTVLVLVVVGAVLRFGRWQSYVVGEAESVGERWNRVKSSPATWTAVFLLLSLGFGGLAVLWVSDTSLPGAGMFGVALAALGALVLGGYLFVGVYNAARSRGRPAAWGLFEAVVMVGFAAVVAIMVNLVV